MFTSKLFNRIYVSSTLFIILLFSVMFLLSVPFIQTTVEKIEEDSARTILNNVYAMVELTHLELENYRQSVTLERKEQLRNILLVADARIRGLLVEVRSGKIGKEEARRTFLNELRRIKYGHNDYIWASDYNSVLISHPDPKLDGADFSKVKDTRGNLVVPPMVEMALKGAGNGYYSYWWRRLGKEVPVEKLTYFKHIPEFGIVIGTGVYLDDINEMVQMKKNVAVENLRQTLRQIRIGKTGYIYIFDGRYFMHIHPNSNIDNSDVSRMLDYETKKPLFSRLVAVADKEQSLGYLWDKPSDPGNYRYRKISWVRYFKEFDWYIGSSIYLDELGESAHTLRNRVLAVFIGTLLLSVALIYVFVNKLTAPLLQMRDAVTRVMEGDLDARCMLKRNDEIGTVAMAFDNMVERMKENIEHLDAKVAERTAELEKACAELKELDQLKSDFLSSVSHELRTPITTVSGFVKQVKKKLESAVFPMVAEDEKTSRAISQVRENLDIVVNEGERLSKIVNDLLYCATLEAGKVDWNFAKIEPEQLLKRCAAAFVPMAEQKGLELRMEIESDLPGVVGDETRLLHVLSNLVDNAVKFTEQGSILLSAGEQDEFVRFTVQDTGQGILAEDQKRVFDKFSQIGDTLTSKPEGTGLGLSICRQIVQHHGGEIWIELAPGGGCRFNFTLPIDKSGSAA
ncbi:MAG: cache domain-containing protein [Desulfuromonadaceae bacterium]|nr:cache domain-containing protein [Desulfuromonadaceae bacterium]